MKEYRTIPIQECGEQLVPIPDSGVILLTNPHPYVAIGAPYNGANPWMLREGVLAALFRAQERLTQLRPGWKLLLFDTYRPNDVQAFMVEWEFRQQSGGRPSNAVQGPEYDALYEKVWRVWAIPSTSTTTPPPHSTGAAIDLTIADAKGMPIDMGSPIDENSDRSYPDHFKLTNPAVHANRMLLHDVLATEGFRRWHKEWWHFSLGDQIWAWEERQANPGSQAISRYGRADLLTS